MNYEDFEKFVRERCMYETIYDDSDGRPILVMRLLDAYGMVNKAVAAEREACAQIAHDTYEGFGPHAKGVDYVKQSIMIRIRERGAP